MQQTVKSVLLVKEGIDREKKTLISNVLTHAYGNHQSKQGKQSKTMFFLIMFFLIEESSGKRIATPSNSKPKEKSIY